VTAVLVDDLDESVPVPDRVQRVVSLVPSLTESVALSAPGLLVGATDWCTHPAGLDVVRVGGTKNPDVDAVVALEPDLVLANDEENRRPDIVALRERGVAVWVTGPRTLAQAFRSLTAMLVACRVGPQPWVDEARRAWSNTVDGSPPWAHAAVPVWRRPWMVLGSDTFAGDVLAHLGVANVFGAAAERYPRTTVEEITARNPDLVVLPDEPYAFAPDDGPDQFPGVRSALVSGRHLTWYGPSLLEARDLLEVQLRGALR
jgi:ABC-type Fe3+-hydroxamate transport system substrate-binding protein